MADDDVQLTDLEVIQRYSLAVRGATASRGDLIAALQADLDWLRGGRRATAATGARDAPAKAPAAKAPAAKAPAAKAPAKGPAKAPPEPKGKPKATAKAGKRSTPAKRPAKG